MNITDEEVMERAKQLHDKECMPDCSMPITDSWLDYARSQLEGERKEREVTSSDDIVAKLRTLASVTNSLEVRERVRVQETLLQAADAIEACR